MKNYDEATSTWMDKLPGPRRGGRWFLLGGLALAFAFMLGMGVLLGTTVSTAQNASAATASSTSAQTLAVGSGSTNVQALNVAQGNANNAQTFAAGPGAPGQCEMFTVSSVSGNTIIAKTANGNTVTIHTTASTKYTQAGKTVTASAIKAGSQISVMGTHNSDGSITASSIDIH
jgi:hypothetical protein